MVPLAWQSMCGSGFASKSANDACYDVSPSKSQYYTRVIPAIAQAAATSSTPMDIGGMPQELPSLPYALNALAPVISQHSLAAHHGGFHARYLKRLNELGAGECSLEEIMLTQRSEAQACACQAWNHTFLWQCLTPWFQPLDKTTSFYRDLTTRWGSFEHFQSALRQSAMAHFMGGWTWLVLMPSGELDVQNAADAGSPILRGQTPLLAIDMWEHAWSSDYAEDRGKYIDRLWTIINWPFVVQCYEDAKALPHRPSAPSIDQAVRAKASNGR